MTSGDPRREAVARALWQDNANHAGIPVQFNDLPDGMRARWYRKADAALAAAAAARPVPPDVAGLVERLRDGRDDMRPFIRAAADALVALAARAEKAEAEVERLDQARRDIIDASGQQCGCGYDRPDDVCLGHLPMVNALKARAEKAEAALREAREAMADQQAMPDDSATARIDALLEDRT